MSRSVDDRIAMSSTRDIQRGVLTVRTSRPRQEPFYDAAYA